MDLSSSRAPCPATVVRRRHQRRRTLTSCPLPTEPASVRPPAPSTSCPTRAALLLESFFNKACFFSPHKIWTNPKRQQPQDLNPHSHTSERDGGEGGAQLILFLDSFLIPLLDVRSCIKSKILTRTQTQKSLRSSAAI